MSDRGQSSTGVIYISFGEMYRDLTTLSISSLRRFGYGGPVRILTDRQDWDIDHLDCEIVDVPSAGEGFDTQFYKTQLNKFGFPVTLYLDADTLPISSIDQIWKELRWGDICLAHDLQSTVGSFVDVSWEKLNLRRDELEHMNGPSLRELPYFNSGVMLWNQCPAIDRLFQEWHREWQRFRNLDQMALSRALSQVRPKLHTLSTVWNCPANRFPSIASAQTAGVRILHFLSRQRNLLPRFVEEYSGQALQPSLGSFLEQSYAAGA